jgi:hypothetical protein
MRTPPTTTLCCLITSLLLACIAAVQAAEPLAVKSVLHDLTPLQDAAWVLVNTHKGWYHHFPDNHPNKYKIARDADLLELPWTTWVSLSNIATTMENLTPVTTNEKFVQYYCWL